MFFFFFFFFYFFFFFLIKKKTTKQAKWESGLDNSPMYDAAKFVGSQLNQVDVGQTGFFLADCDILAAFADQLGRSADAADLRARRAAVAANVSMLWDAQLGIFANWDLAHGSLVPRFSPTSFYLMLSGTATVAQAETMVQTWLYSNHGFCVGPGATPMPGQAMLHLYYSPSAEDNTVCVHTQASGALACPSNMVPEQNYDYYRPEGIPVVSADAAGTVALSFFYSATNRDSFIGTNATFQPGYVNLGPAGVAVYADPPNSSFVPLDLYWNAARRDVQPVANPLSRQYLAGYTFLQRLGYVLLPPSQQLPCAFGMPSIHHNDTAFADNDYWLAKKKKKR